jgi:hypothetical protein
MHQPKLGAIAAGLAVIAASAVGLLQQAPAFAGFCPYVEGCPAPANVANTVNGHDVKLSWDFPSFGASPYAQGIYRGTDSVQLLDPQRSMTEVLYRDSGERISSFTDANVPNGHYVYAVCSIFWDGQQDSAYPACTPAQPEGITVGSGGGSSSSGGGSSPGGSSRSGGGGSGGSGGGTPPPPPTLTAPTNVQVTERTHTSLTLSWTPGTGGDTVALGCTESHLQDMCGHAGLWAAGQETTDSVTADVTSFTYTNLKPGQAYHIRLLEDEPPRVS